MHVGSLLNRLGAQAPALALLTSLTLPVYDAAAQSPFAGNLAAGNSPAHSAQAPNAARDAVQALYLSPSSGGLFGGQQSPYMDAHGNPVVVPVSYWQSQAGGQACPPGMGSGGTYPSVGYDLANDIATDGYVVDQRGPHYFDARVEFINFTPDDNITRDIAFTSLNIGGTDIVLSSRDLELDYEPGFRAMGRYDLGPLSVVEFGYMGIYDWKSQASFTDPNPVDGDTGNLYSLFSEFGTNPPGVAIEGGPMPGSERSITQSLSLDVDLHTAEISYRRYWVGHFPRVTGTLLAGARFTRYKESLQFSTVGEEALDAITKAENDLTGFQTGGDIWISLFQGVRIGMEGKVGIYNNNYVVDNVIINTPGPLSPPDLVERFASNNAAAIGEASVDIVFDILPSWSIRAGYEVLYINSLVLALENFNTASPYDLPSQAARVPYVFDQGNAYMHGGHVGIEFIW